jgi:hypothetical protein
MLQTRCSVKDVEHDNGSPEANFSQYSAVVEDSFQIRVQLPLQYFERPDEKFTTVVLLDGNFFYPMLSPVLHQYEVTGLLKPVILVSIGYDSFSAMDSLRVRDYLFPEALPSDELVSIGGGQRFFRFIEEELLPKIDKEYRTKEFSRCLLGHSFGGYFVLYSLLHQLEESKNTFTTFIAASPTLWYNEFYLNKLPTALAQNSSDSINIFMTVGALEDSVWSVRPLKSLAASIQQLPEKVHLEPRVYSHLEHMDVGMISFVKGLQQFLNAAD